MRYIAYHGSEGPAFARFDPARSGTSSGYGHAKGMASFTGDLDLATHYANGNGFIGRFAFTLDHPLELDDAERHQGFAVLLAAARDAGHDGVILRRCAHTGIAPTGPADLYFVFDLSAPRLVEVVQEGPLEAPARTPAPAVRRRRV